MSRSYWALVLNYGRWRETIRCAESLLASVESPERLILCDNGSGDDSLEALARWAEEDSRRGGLRRFSRAQAEAGALSGDERIVLIDTGANLGYAGGNNVGLRLGLASGAPHVWLLNNDTTVFPDAASALLDHMAARERCGLCGALTRYMDDPEVVQCLGGGWFAPLWGRGGLHGDGLRLPLGAEPPDPPERLDYVNGASVFIRREFLLDVGLMEEAYFLYCEELDWAARAARSRGRWELCWSPRAQVLHAEGLSTGVSNRRGKGRGLRQALTLLRSRLLYTWKFHPLCLPMALAGQVWALARKLPRRLGSRAAE
ncbi:glycosyltransferase [Desulfovibrio aminophilus]|uniref:glycosyltransferase n=1 Tax=Desulfovibrio aminophilus TaxID=81425 RepID=UPI00339372CB